MGTIPITGRLRSRDMDYTSYAVNELRLLAWHALEGYDLGFRKVF